MNLKDDFFLFIYAKKLLAKGKKKSRDNFLRKKKFKGRNYLFKKQFQKIIKV